MSEEQPLWSADTWERERVPEPEYIPTIWGALRMSRLLRRIEESVTMNTQAPEGENHERDGSTSQNTDPSAGEPAGGVSRPRGALPAGEAVPRPEAGRREPNHLEWQRGLSDQEVEEIQAVFGYGFPGIYAAMFQSAYLNPTPYCLMPQELADQLALVTDDATLWFHDHTHVVQVDRPELEPITDQEVHDRIQGMQYSMDREIARLSPFQYGAAWNWRFDADWREKHTQWVNDFNAELTKPEFATKVREAHVWRYDLSKMPWINQYNLCVRWQRIWAEWKDGIGGASGDQHYDPVEADEELEKRRKAREEANPRD